MAHNLFKSRKTVHEMDVKDLTKEKCQELLAYITPQEKESYDTYIGGGTEDSWQVAIVMSGIWKKYSHLLDIELEVIVKETQEKQEQEAVQKREHKLTGSFADLAFVKKELIDPSFDFGSFYEVGQTIFYVQHFETLNKKRIMELKIRSVYARMIVGVLEHGFSQCIGYETKDFIFFTRKAAVECLDSLVGYDVETDADTDTKKKPVDFDVDSEEDDDSKETTLITD